MSDDDALRDFAIKLFAGKRDNTARLFGQAPDAQPGTAPIVVPRHSPADQAEEIHEPGGWHGVVDPRGIDWLFGGEQ